MHTLAGPLVRSYFLILICKVSSFAFNNLNNLFTFIIAGGVAAHAFGPGTYTISGNIHLDDAEPWTQSVDPKDGINLLAVAIHQIGLSKV